MKYESWKSIFSIEGKFGKSLQTICDMLKKIADASKGDVNKYQTKMRELQDSDAFRNYVNSAVRRMVTPLSVRSEKTWREAARKATRGNKLYKLLLKEISGDIKPEIDRQIAENISLITTLPTETAAKVVKNINNLAFQGMRASEIAKIIRTETDKHARASARLIARTEVSKTSTALTQARAKKLGVNWYVWRTSLDGDRVRESHQRMEGVLINWNDPPSPEALVGEKSVGKYHAGNIWNCRCYPEPFLDIDDVHWPHEVYTNGKIQKMQKKQFEQLM